MEALIERVVCTNARCYSCGTLVYAVEKKMTTNHIYHNRCFRCRICKRNLNGSSLNEEGDDIYCTNCYRKKQRGDCKDLNFQKAADEQTLYVENRHHPDQPPPKKNCQPPIQRRFSRQLSGNLRKIERQFLSYQGPNTDTHKNINGTYRKIIPISHHSPLKTSFSAPITVIKLRRNSSLTKDESTPPLHFSPAFSLTPNTPTKSPVTTPRTLKKFSGIKFNFEQPKPINDIKPRLNQSTPNLTIHTSPLIERKRTIITELHKKNGNKDEKKVKFYFPNTIFAAPPRRSSSANSIINRQKKK